MTTTHNTFRGTKGTAAFLLSAAVLACCGACGQPWTFTQAAYPGQAATQDATPAQQTPPPLEPPPAPLAPPVPPAILYGDATPYRQADADRPQNAAQDPVPPFIPGEFEPIEPAAENPILDASLEAPAHPLIEPLPPLTDTLCPTGETAAFRGGSRLGAMWQEAKQNVRQDYTNYYSWPNLRDLALGFAVASPIANTSLDGGFRDWYQDDVRSRDTDNVARFFKTFGEGQIFIPAFAVLAATGQYFTDRPLLGTVGDYSGRVTRAYLVGAPPMLLMQYVTGAGRPGESADGSYWQPFKDNNGVSGHAFMGSVPFITAARMADNPFAKVALYGLSTFTGWSRINDDDHYLSQVVLGWWMGYLACRAVDDTQQANKRLTLSPVATPGMVGVAMVYQR